MQIAELLGVILLLAVAALAVATRHSTPLRRKPELRAMPVATEAKAPTAARDPDGGAVTIVTILIAVPAALHYYSLVEAFFRDPRSPVYALLDWLANF